MTIPGIYSQRDARWSSILLGFNRDLYYNLYHFGCAVVGVSNIIWYATGDSSWTPDRINQWLKDNQGFTDGNNVNAGGLIRWGALARLLASFDIVYRGYTTSLAGTNSFLAPENNFALAQLTKAGFPMHFSAMPYVGQIADSWDARLKPVGSYSFVGAHMYSKIVRAVTPPVPAAAVLSPAPIQTPAIPPAVPVPSVEKPIANPNPETEMPAPAAEPIAEPGKGQATEIPVASTPDPETPALTIGKTYPLEKLDRLSWVEPSQVGGAVVRDVRDGSPLSTIPYGTKFQVLYFARRIPKDSINELFYLVTKNGATAEITQGIDPTDLRRSTAPTVDNIGSKSADAPLEINLDDFSKAGRTILKALHAVFGDWHVFKFRKKDKE